ncbi:MAG: hypothetical protein AUJ72_01805 [Candidatus Omnitrophica bacterium CG1_02_46_14]|nr:MAG: hypothetical protein AUJ72_01805 [Candidatus Omnitrophica bacterium CG1_02_46_14]
MKKKYIYLISDSTGELGERFTNALITQFPNDEIVLEKFNFIDDETELQSAFSKITDKGSILFHTVVSKKLKKKIEVFGKEKKVPSFDLTGPPTDFMTKFLNVKPVWDIQSIHRIDAAYNKRIDAIEFTINHDDGVGGITLKHADAVLVGPSRTSKTPTSIYLATKGFSVANVPIVPVVGIPRDLALLKGDPKVIGFSITPSKLQEMRIKRAAGLGSNPKGYTDLDEIKKEIHWARQMYEAYGWETIDITGRAIEETAALIMKKIRKEK